MENLNIEEFNPKVAELQTLASKAQAVDITDLKAVREVRLELKTARVEITKTGKVMRENATAFAKAVIEKEKELIGLIEPEEKKLQEAETAEKLRQEREERRAILPTRVKRLQDIWGEGVQLGVTEEELLDMDGSTFEGFVNKSLSEKNALAQAEIARKQAELDAKQVEQDEREAKLKEEEQEAERAENEAKEAEQKRAEDEKRQLEEQTNKRAQYLVGLGLVEAGDSFTLDTFVEVPKTELRDMEPDVWAVLAERIKNEVQRRKDVAEAEANEEKRQADERYQAWLNENDYTADRAHLYQIVDNSGTVELYQFKARYTK